MDQLVFIGVTIFAVLVLAIIFVSVNAETGPDGFTHVSQGMPVENCVSPVYGTFGTWCEVIFDDGSRGTGQTVNGEWEILKPEGSETRQVAYRKAVGI